MSIQRSILHVARVSTLLLSDFLSNATLLAQRREFWTTAIKEAKQRGRMWVANNWLKKTEQTMPAQPKLLIVSTKAVTQRAFLLPLAKHFRGIGWSVDGMASEISTCSECQAVFDHTYDIEWSRNPFNPNNLTLATARVQKVVQAGKYDIVHVHTPVASFITRLALCNWRHSGKRTVIYTAHGFHFHSRGKAINNLTFLALERLAGQWTDYLVVINHEDRAAAHRHLIVKPQRIRYMPGIGIDLKNYRVLNRMSVDTTNLWKELKVSSEQVLFLMIASFDTGKRHGDLLQSLAMLKRKEIVVAFAGTGPLQHQSLEVAHDLGIADQVRFLGFREDIPSLITASRATLLPSEREGLPRSVMESMALGTPVIGADARGTRDLLASGAGIIVPVGDPYRLALAMSYLLDNPDRAKQMGEVGQRDIQQYDLEIILSLHEQLYQEALNLLHL